MRIFKMKLHNADGSLTSFDQLAAQYGAASVRRLDRTRVDALPDGELNAEQVAVVLASVQPQDGAALDD
jgi:hypothetical protein